MPSVCYFPPASSDAAHTTPHGGLVFFLAGTWRRAHPSAPGAGGRGAAGGAQPLWQPARVRGVRARVAFPALQPLAWRPWLAWRRRERRLCRCIDLQRRRPAAAQTTSTTTATDDDDDDGRRRTTTTTTTDRRRRRRRRPRRRRQAESFHAAPGAAVTLQWRKTPVRRSGAATLRSQSLWSFANLKIGNCARKAGLQGDW